MVLGLQPSPFDPVGSSLAGANLAGQQYQNATLLQALQQRQRQQGVLEQFRAAGGLGNPQALSALHGDPELYTSALGAIGNRQNWALMQGARAAQGVMSAGDERSDGRIQAYRSALARGVQEGWLTPEQHAQLTQRDPTDLFLYGIISQAMPLTQGPTNRELFGMFGLNPDGSLASDRPALSAPSANLPSPSAVPGVTLQAPSDPLSALPQLPYNAAETVPGVPGAAFTNLPPPSAAPAPPPVPVTAPPVRRPLPPSEPSLLRRFHDFVFPPAGGQAPVPGPLPDAAAQPFEGAGPLPEEAVPLAQSAELRRMLAAQQEAAPAAAGQPVPAAAAGPRNPRELIARATTAQRAGLALLLAKRDFDNVAKLLREIETGGMTERQRAESEEGLRREFSTLAKPYFEVRDAFGRIEVAARNPSAAGDLALIFNFMKILDPVSTVREGEFATAQNAGGVPDRIKALYNRIARGERLTEDQRGDFVNQSRNLMTEQERQYLAIQNQYGGIAQRLGLNQQNVLIDFRRPAPNQAETQRLLTEAREALAAGRNPAAVEARLRQLGVDPSLLNR